MKSLCLAALIGLFACQAAYAADGAAAPKAKTQSAGEKCRHRVPRQLRRPSRS